MECAKNKVRSWTRRASDKCDRRREKKNKKERETRCVDEISAAAQDNPEQQGDSIAYVHAKTGRITICRVGAAANAN